MFLNVFLPLILFTISSEAFSYVNDTDECTSKDSSEKLVCVNLLRCEKAKDLLFENKLPQMCGFNGFEPKVCCHYPEERIHISGNLARDACIHLKIQLASKKPANRQRREEVADDILAVIGGRKAKRKELKHMALIGTDLGKKRRWLCGGSLIHKEFVLTAAHCLASAKYIRLGDLDYTTDNDNSQYQDFNVSKVFKHPNYTFSSTYNDIALLKLNRPVIFNEFVQPACLHSSKEFNYFGDKFVIAGWGEAKSLANEGSSHLKKAYVTVLPHNICSEAYPKSRRLHNGIVEELQLCAGSYDDETDTCGGDSGGPLEFDEQWSFDTISTVIGVTSFGKACGFKGIPGIYTRVSGYIKWIEEIVWKGKS